MNRFLRSVLVTFLIGTTIYTGQSLMLPSTARADSASSCHGGGNSQRGDYWLRCDKGSHSHDDGGTLGGQGGRYYIYLWLAACPNTYPGDPGSLEIDCPGAHNCPNPREMSLSLYSRLMSEQHQPLSGWRYMLTECKSKAKIGPGDPRHPLRWEDIRSAIKRMGLPRATVDGPEFTLVNLRTTFYTSTSTHDATFHILGFVVDIHVAPVSYVWHWGDGTTMTTHTPGRPYPAHDVTHTYRHSTTADHPLPLRVDVAYQARFRVDGGSWIPINDRLVVVGQTKNLPVKQASAVLVPPR